jgi:hypothetical protein
MAVELTSSIKICAKACAMPELLPVTTATGMVEGGWTKLWSKKRPIQSISPARFVRKGEVCEMIKAVHIFALNTLSHLQNLQNFVHNDVLFEACSRPVAIPAPDTPGGNGLLPRYKRRFLRRGGSNRSSAA